MSERTAHAEIRELSEALLETSDRIIENLFYSLKTGNNRKNLKVLKRVEYAIAIREIEIEERCMTYLALVHPVAIDLRNVISIMKINEELARINDLTLYILERMDQINPELIGSFEFKKIGLDIVRMFKMAMDAYNKKDLSLVEQIFAIEQEVHIRVQKVFRTAVEFMRSSSNDTDQFLSSLSLARKIGRITEHISTIVCSVSYLVKGDVVVRNDRFYNHLVDAENLSSN
jgi:phosphate transport system protein